MDLGTIVQVVLFLLFAAVTSALNAVIGPTYDNLLVPELGTAVLYPTLPPFGAPSGFLGEAASFSGYLLANLVDPAIGLVALIVGLLYLGRAVVGTLHDRLEATVPKLILAVVLANFTVPIAGGLLAIGGAAFPVIAGFDGGAWEHWQNLAGVVEGKFTWDNGALAFVLDFALFSLVLLLAIAVAVRDALLAVLLVLLPILTLLWPVPALAPLTRRGWTLFGELTFLPCVLVIPLELAVGSPSILLLLGFLVVALGSPSLVSLGSASLTQLGMPSGGAAVTGGIQRGLSVGALTIGGMLRPRPAAGAGPSAATAALGQAAQLAARAPLPAAAPLLGAELVGRGATHLVRHLRQRLPSVSGGGLHFPPVRRGAGGRR